MQHGVIPISPGCVETAELRSSHFAARQALHREASRSLPDTSCIPVSTPIRVLEIILQTLHTEARCALGASGQLVL